MSSTLALMTELEAVNLMLEVIGESPVSQLENTGLVDAVIARSLLRRKSRQVQAKGWNWNTDLGLSLSPDVNGYLLLPSNALKVDPVDPYKDWIQRGNKLWDRRNHTFESDDSVKVDITYFFNFETIPQAARDYIAICAARQFQDRFLGSETLNAFNANDEAEAWADLLHEEGENADWNALTDNATTVGIVLTRQG